MTNAIPHIALFLLLGLLAGGGCGKAPPPAPPEK
jgi:hypothetical protein